jgi:hypothetical protein
MCLLGIGGATWIWCDTAGRGQFVITRNVCETWASGPLALKLFWVRDQYAMRAKSAERYCGISQVPGDSS